MSKAIRVASNATVVGEVTLGENTSVWYGAVLRGDDHFIRVGSNTNIQDNCVLHTSSSTPVILGDNVTVGHAAIIHGCTVENGALVGMGAILLNGCVVGEEAMVAAGALVPQGMVIPPRMLAVGSPARVVRPLREEELARSRQSSVRYVSLARQLPLWERGL